MSLYEDENKMVIGELWHEKEDAEYLADCALCGNEADEEMMTHGICERCWVDHLNIDNALSYGNRAQESIKINGLYAKVLTPEQINEALKAAFLDMKKFYYDFTYKAAFRFIGDDESDYADWLKEQKNID